MVLYDGQVLSILVRIHLERRRCMCHCVCVNEWNIPTAKRFSMLLMTKHNVEEAFPHTPRLTHVTPALIEFKTVELHGNHFNNRKTRDHPKVRILWEILLMETVRFSLSKFCATARSIQIISSALYFRISDTFEVLRGM